MNEFDYLEYEYYDAQAKWQTASGQERETLRDQLIRLAKRADLEPTADGLRLADGMRQLAETIDEQLRQMQRFIGVSEEFQLTYEHIKQTWHMRDGQERLHMLAQLTEMGQRRDVDRRFLLELTTLHGEIMAALNS